MEKNNMKTLSQVMAILAERGINKEFHMNENGEMKREAEERVYQSEDLVIAKTYRFEGESNPDDSSILYVIESADGEKGFLIDSYGAESNYSGEDFGNFVRSMKEKDDEIYNIE